MLRSNLNVDLDLDTALADQANTEIMRPVLTFKIYFIDRKHGTCCTLPCYKKVEIVELSVYQFR